MDFNVNRRDSVQWETRKNCNEVLSRVRARLGKFLIDKVNQVQIASFFKQQLINYSLEYRPNVWLKSNKGLVHLNLNLNLCRQLIFYKKMEKNVNNFGGNNELKNRPKMDEKSDVK